MHGRWVVWVCVMFSLGASSGRKVEKYVHYYETKNLSGLSPAEEFIMNFFFGRKSFNAKIITIIRLSDAVKYHDEGQMSHEGHKQHKHGFEHQSHFFVSLCFISNNESKHIG